MTYGEFIKNNPFGLNKTDYPNGKFMDQTKVQISKIIQKIKWILLNKLGIRPNCPDYLWY